MDMILHSIPPVLLHHIDIFINHSTSSSSSLRTFCSSAAKELCNFLC